MPPENKTTLLVLRCPSAPQGSHFLCLLSFGETKESEATPAGRTALAEKQQKQPSRSTSPNPRRCKNPRTPGHLARKSPDRAYRGSQLC